MADAFNTLLNDVSAPTVASPRSGGSTPPIVRSDTGDLLRGVSGILAMGGEIAKEHAHSELEKSIDQNIETAFQNTLGVSSDGVITSALDNLEKSKNAAEQGKGSSDRFYLNLMATSKQLKNKFPNRIGEIDKMFRERGLTDPRIALVNNQVAREKAESDAVAKRDNALFDKAHAEGWAIYSTPGDPNSPIDKEATKSFAHEAAESAQKHKRMLGEFGIVENSTGTRSYQPRTKFIQNFPELSSTFWDITVKSLRPEVTRLQQAVSGARPEDIGEIKKLFTDIVEKKNALIEQARGDLFDKNLNPAETELYMKMVNDSIISLTSGVTGLDDIKDLNHLKAITQSYDFLTANSKILNAQEFPVFTQLNNLNPQLAQSIMSLAMFDNDQKLRLGKVLGSELSKLGDMFPTSRDPKNSDVKLRDTEKDLGKADKVDRVNGAMAIQDSFIEKGILATDRATSLAWVNTQAPLFNAYLAGLSPEDRGLTKTDKATLASQFTTSNYVENFKIAKKNFPEHAADLGGYAFDIVMDRVIDSVRELRSSGTSFLKVGEDIKIKYDSNRGQFVLDQSAIDRFAPGAQRSLDRSGDPALNKRLAQINAALPILKETREFKESFKEFGNAEFMQTISDLVTRDITQVGTSEASATEILPSSDVTDEGPALGIRGFTDPVNLEIDPTLPEAIQNWKRGERGLGPITLPTAIGSPALPSPGAPRSLEPTTPTGPAGLSAQPELTSGNAPLRAILESLQQEGKIRITPEWQKVLDGFKGELSEKAIELFKPELGENFNMNDVVKMFENAGTEGRDHRGLWYPYESLESGTQTVGYGHKLTKEEQRGSYTVIDGQKVPFENGLTDMQIEKLLAQDMNIASSFVDKQFPGLATNQKEALTSLVFNVGITEFKTSKAYDHLKANNVNKFAIEAFDPKKGFVRMTKNGRKIVMPGLVNRRQKEKELFFAAVEQSSDRA